MLKQVWGGCGIFIWENNNNTRGGGERGGGWARRGQHTALHTLSHPTIERGGEILYIEGIS